MMTHAPVRLKRAWSQEIDGGNYLIKGITPSGKILFLKRTYNGVWDFVSDRELASTYAESTTNKHIAEITRSITKRRYHTYLLTDNRKHADLLFVVLINGTTYGGVFDRAERAESVVDAYNQSNKGNAATYIEVTGNVNQLYQEETK